MKGRYNDAATLRRVKFAKSDIELRVTNGGRDARVRCPVRSYLALELAGILSASNRRRCGYLVRPL